MSGIIKDHLGEDILEGDLLLIGDNVFRAVKISSPAVETNLSLVQKPTAAIPRIVFMRVIADLTITGEYNKRLKNIFKLHAKLPSSSDQTS